jgi:phosphate transport system substrate-binding protein
MFSMLKTSLCAAFAVAALAFSGGTAHAQVRIQGAGATFPAPLYNKWIEEYGKTNSNVKIDYSAVGSGTGIANITNRIVQFGASDAPLNPTQDKALPAKILHLPTVAGPVVMIYNIKGVDKLKLDGDVIAGIYLKQIKTWNDPKIAAINPGVTLPNAPIVVVHRSDGSGTSYIFTDYLSKVSKQWETDIGANTAPDWPVGIAGKGSDGVTAAVKNSEGSIGYVELAYAEKNKLSYATQINKDGKEVKPTIDAVNAAAKSALAKFPEDMKVSITNAAGADSYPICGYTYLLVYEDLSYTKDKAQATETLKFILWCETEGQKFAADLGYAKLPQDAQDKVVAKLKAITFDGAALLK